MSHNCRYCIVGCMDFRIQETTQQLWKSLDLRFGDFDFVGVAGGAANTEQLKKHLKLSNDLHHSREFILTAHEDCGAGATKDDLREAVRWVRGQYPQHQIQAYFIHLDGTWEKLA